VALRQEGSHRVGGLRGHSDRSDQRHDGYWGSSFDSHFDYGANLGDPGRALADRSVYDSNRHPFQERSFVSDSNGDGDHHGFVDDQPNRNQYLDRQRLYGRRDFSYGRAYGTERFENYRESEVIAIYFLRT